jgi:hypothetical protein
MPQHGPVSVLDVFERRKSARFEIHAEVRYRILSRSGRVTAFGKTVNISSGGVLFTTDQRIPLRAQVELAIEWPVRLNDKTDLCLVILGQVIRSAEMSAAIEIVQYEFRTKSHGSTVDACPPII